MASLSQASASATSPPQEHSISQETFWVLQSILADSHQKYNWPEAQYIAQSQQWAVGHVETQEAPALLFLAGLVPQAEGWDAAELADKLALAVLTIDVPALFRQAETFEMDVRDIVRAFIAAVFFLLEFRSPNLEGFIQQLNAMPVPGTTEAEQAAKDRVKQLMENDHVNIYGMATNGHKMFVSSASLFVGICHRLPHQRLHHAVGCTFRQLSLISCRLKLYSKYNRIEERDECKKEQEEPLQMPRGSICVQDGSEAISIASLLVEDLQR